MASTFKTPGVYIREISKFPPSVAQVETAIPGFIGFTEKAKKKKDNDLHLEPTRITSLLEFFDYYGGPDKQDGIEVTLEDNTSIPTDVLATAELDDAARSTNLLYHAMQSFLDNGCGPCYIISVGNFDRSNDLTGSGIPAITGDLDRFKLGLEAGKLIDEITLYVFPEAVLGLGDSEYNNLVGAALDQCVELQDRFTIMDVKTTEEKPHIDAASFRNTIQIVQVDKLKYGASYYPDLDTIYDYAYDEDDLNITDARQESDDTGDTSMPDFASLDSVTQNKVKLAVANIPCKLPPSPIMAGIYAKVDSTRGVWKAPANVGVAGVIAPTKKINDLTQGDLNVDVTAGKSINAIRTFIGKGSLVWGARTLAGNDNEWRYVSVRRFFNMAEESIKKATGQFVFEPNDANTWVKVRAMIENFLITQWSAGALAGATPDDAFYVKVGLNETMSALDILEGRMIVEIGMAVVRPAEFIILKFSHKMQES